MKYEDFCTPSEQEYKLMKQNYIKMQAQENEDLQEMLNKMNEQLARLKGNNSDGKYDEIIAKLTSSINELASLISTNQSQFLRKIKKMDDDINNSNSSTDNSANSAIDNGNSFTNNNSPDTGVDTRSPLENTGGGNENSGRDDIENSIDLDNSNNTDSSGSANSDGNTPNNSATAGRNTTKRNSPMPGNAIFNAFKSLNVNLNNNLNRLFGMKIPTKSKSVSNTRKVNPQADGCVNCTPPMPPYLPFPPFGNEQPAKHKCKPVPPCGDKTPHQCEPHEPPCPPYEHNKHPLPNKPPHECTPPHKPNKYQPPLQPPNDDLGDGCGFEEVCRHNQIDIIRLFLLYMMMRPTCRYLPTITAIANAQFEILMTLL